MPKFAPQTLEMWMDAALEKLGMNAQNRFYTRDTVMRATLRGVGHHDIYDFPARLKALASGKIPANPEMKPIASFGAMESWDGGGGLGEVVCSFAMERAMRLADVHGMGLCAVRNSNHFMAAAPYVERASECGYIGLILCKGAPSMGAPGRREQTIGALPMGFALPTDHGYPIMLDACMAYASFGLLREKMKKGEPVPEYWGFDGEGRPTADPAQMASGTRLPIGAHKGFGLAILGEALTAILSEGCVVDEPDTVNGQKAPTSHTAIAIKTGALMEEKRFRERAGEMIDRMSARAPGLHVPGQGSHQKAERMRAQNAVQLDEALVEELNAICARIGAPQL